jgi:hypothetical protein
LRANLEAILTFATASEARSGDNPARWSDLKSALLARDYHGFRVFGV